MDEQSTLIFLDVIATTGIRMTSFGGTIEDCVADMRKWVEENHVLPEQIAQADMYEKESKDSKPIHIAEASMDAEGNILVAKPEHPKIFVEPKRTLKSRRIGRQLERALRANQKAVEEEEEE